jgi:hypothetical protein
MIAMKARRGTSGEQVEAIGSVITVWPGVYQRRRTWGGGRAGSDVGGTVGSQGRDCPVGRARVRVGDKNATVSADPALISHH